MRKLSRVTFVQSSEVKSATMFGLQFRKSGQLWLMASQAQKFGTPIFSYGGHIINLPGTDNFAEQPARLTLDDRALLTEWKPSYKWGFMMQAALALIGAVLGAIAWWQLGQYAWLIGAILLFANWPLHGYRHHARQQAANGNGARECRT
jgi:hypothetical protein